jgi:flagellar basal-body rod protein FlgB
MPLAPDFLSDTAAIVIGKTLDATAARQKSIANNIANVETPGYKRSYVSFEEELRSVLSRKDRREIQKALSELVPVRRNDVFSPARPDGNNVNIDAEIADLAKTGLKHRAAAVLLEGKIAMLRAAITEGKR